MKFDEYYTCERSEGLHVRDYPAYLRFLFPLVFSPEDLQGSLSPFQVPVLISWLTVLWPLEVDSALGALEYRGPESPQLGRARDFLSLTPETELPHAFAVVLI